MQLKSGDGADCAAVAAEEAGAPRTFSTWLTSPRSNDASPVVPILGLHVIRHLRPPHSAVSSAQPDSLLPTQAALRVRVRK